MKKLFYLLTIVSFVACTNDEEMNLLTETMPEESVSVEKRSFQEALEVAQGAPEIFGGTTTRGELKQVTLANTQYIIGEATTRNEAPDTLMYVFNYEDNQGFAVVSANKSTEALIAVTEQGNYNEETTTDNPGLALYMDMAKNYVARGGILPPGSSIGGGGLPLTEIRTVTTRDTLAYINPLLEVRWGGGYPYNFYCTNSNNLPISAGCEVIALAQLFSFYEYPANMLIDYNPNNAHTLSINWDSFKSHPRHTNCNCGSSTLLDLAYMFRQIGEELDIEYYNNNSSANFYDIMSYFSRLNYSHSGMIDYNTSTISNSLSNNKLVIIQGMENGETTGHAWLIDGYRSIEITSKEYRRQQGQLDWTLYKTTTSYESYQHFNWGYDGDSNGYYATNVFDMNRCSYLDEGVDEHNDLYEFENSIKIIANISH